MFVNRSDEVSCYETERSRRDAENTLDSRAQLWFSRMDSEINILDDNKQLSNSIFSEEYFKLELDGAHDSRTSFPGFSPQLDQLRL